MVLVRIPATTANLGPGFDTLGMALNMYNYIYMIETDNDFDIEVTGEGALKVPKDATNLIYRAALKVFQKLNYKPKGLSIKIINNIPLVRGLGSSASVIVGGMVAANYICGNQLTTDEILYMATKMEGHPDNVAPALLGGIIISTEINSEIVYRKIKPPNGLNTVVAIPQYELPTKRARNALPAKVPLKDAVYNMSRVGLLILAFINNDMELLRKVMDDRLHQPYRMSLIPGMRKVAKAAKEAGAYSLVLSGAGPTLISFCKEADVNNIGKAMKNTLNEIGIDCIIKKLLPVINGVEILDAKGENSYEHYSAKIWG
jgi:homoserine kinase